MTFAGDGLCARIPGQSNIPPTAKIHAYPTHERHNIIWIWMGEIEKADHADIFDLPQFDLPEWDAHQGDALHLKCNYLSVAENLVDPAHVSWVHPTTLGSAASEGIPVDFDITENNIIAWRWIRDAPAIGFFQQYQYHRCEIGSSQRAGQLENHRLPQHRDHQRGSKRTQIANRPEEARHRFSQQQ